jgi:hypothetical protein
MASVWKKALAPAAIQKLLQTCIAMGLTDGCNEAGTSPPKDV